MNSYRYRVTVQALTDAHGQSLEQPRLLSFEVANHDDLLLIVDRTRDKELGLATPLRREETAAMVIGLKLLGEVALAHRKAGFFAEIREALGQFVRQLKARPEVGQEQPIGL